MRAYSSVVRLQALSDAEKAITEVRDGFHHLAKAARKSGDTEDAVLHSFSRNAAQDCLREVKKLIATAQKGGN
jgi:hypothetical protein